MIMDKYPPLKILVQWREMGHSPEWIHAKCLEYAGYTSPDRVITNSNRLCSCGNPHLAKGLCRKCYDKQRRLK
jgi:hypothetical protein